MDVLFLFLIALGLSLAMIAAWAACNAARGQAAGSIRSGLLPSVSAALSQSLLPMARRSAGSPHSCSWPSGPSDLAAISALAPKAAAKIRVMPSSSRNGRQGLQTPFPVPADPGSCRVHSGPCHLSGSLQHSQLPPLAGSDRRRHRSSGHCRRSAVGRQLARFRKKPEAKTEVCEEGLWRYSRHPNYFFEWLYWCSWPLLALTGPRLSPGQRFWRQLDVLAARPCVRHPAA